MYEPKSLQDAIVYFSNPDNSIAYLAAKRWPNGVICPVCGSEKVSAFNPDRKTWKCSKHHPKREFSVKVGSLAEDSAIGLDKWLTALWMLTNCKNGISSCELARDLKVTQKTAWFMLHRIRLALQDEDFGGKIGGEVEVDETFIGGKARNMHLSERQRRITGTGGKDKTVVFGMLERDGRIRAKVLPNRQQGCIQAEIKEHAKTGSALYSDEWVAYKGLETDYQHQVVDHAMKYVDGRVHTNGLENFWALLKRGIAGTYVSVEPFHLFRYLDEQVFRYNNRATKDNPLNDSDRFSYVVTKLFGKRLTFAQLTGKLCETSAF
jgi:transposase-like protein